jgi:hypothetical protein
LCSLRRGITYIYKIDSSNPLKYLRTPKTAAKEMIRKAIGAIAFILMAAVVAPAPVLARDVLFLGVTDLRGGPAQPELERELRAEFAADRRFRLIGEVETERIVREMERLGHTRAETVIPKSAGLADSTVIVRGVLRELSVVTDRSWLLWGKINARMRLEVSLSEISGPSSHRGEFSAAASKRKDLILLRSSKKVVHVSATDREELLGQIRTELVKETVDLVSTFFKALSSGGLPPKAPKGGADSSAAAPADSGAEFSTVDGNGVTPIDSAGAKAADGGK